MYRYSKAFLAFFFVLVSFLSVDAASRNQYKDINFLQRSSRPYYDDIAPKTVGEIWPKPQNQVLQTTFMSLDPSNFTFTPVYKDCDILDQALERYLSLIFLAAKPSKAKKWKRGSKAFRMDTLYQGTLTTLQVMLRGTCEKWPYFDMDERYELKVDTEDLPGEAKLIASTTWGILRGLESFSHLIYKSSSSSLFQINSTMVDDFPRFSHRGLLLDSSRHFIPKKILFQNLDAMAFNKMNVFHWHIVDDQSFPYQSITFPELSEEGAYDPDTHVYSQSDIAEVIDYARLRGIRVVPEFDTPGHTLSWGESHPELLTDCFDKHGKQDGVGPIDPSKQTTFDFMQELLKEVTTVFPDSYVHLGGDEVPFDCWQTNANVTSFMMKMGYGNDYHLLEQYYMTNVLKIMDELTPPKNYILWQEIIDNKVNISQHALVEVWKEGYEAELDKVTGLGYKALLASCWYLDGISYGSDWKDFYACEPLSFNGTSDQKKLVLGGEACLWAEYVDGTNLISRLWPRASAPAEKLWSSEATNSTNEAAQRLEEHRCRMILRGINAEPQNGPGFCSSDYRIH